MLLLNQLPLSELLNPHQVLAFSVLGGRKLSLKSLSVFFLDFYWVFGTKVTITVGEAI